MPAERRVGLGAIAVELRARGVALDRRVVVRDRAFGLAERGVDQAAVVVGRGGERIVGGGANCRVVVRDGPLALAERGYALPRSTRTETNPGSIRNTASKSSIAGACCPSAARMSPR